MTTKTWGVVATIMKRGKPRAYWWARYVTHADAKTCFDRRVQDSDRAFFVKMAPAGEPHTCALDALCACVAGIVEVNDVPAREMGNPQED